MAAKKRYVVRVVQVPRQDQNSALMRADLSGTWVEALRYMGHCVVVKPWDGTLEGTEVLEFHAPKGLDDKIWARQNAERMKSFGINAVEAPEWVG